jgi:choline dehydrogenase-like flavoprotein
VSFLLTAALERSAKRNLQAPLDAIVVSALNHLRTGCFQRSLCLIVATTSVASGLEVGYEHYKGSYSNPVMYTPVALSGALAGSGLVEVFSLTGARTILRWISIATHVPDAITHGAEIRSHAMASRISLRDDGRVDGIAYFDRDGKEHFQRSRAVIVSGYAIETPRLLLNSACPSHRHGLANSSGTLGKYLMAQAGNVVAGRFDELIRLYKAPPAHALSEEFYETDKRRDFVRGFAVQTVGPLPVAFAKQMIAAMGAWGWGMRRVMMDYNHWATIGVLGEILPWEDNRVELAEDKDQYGLPVAKVTFNLHDNDKKLIEFGKRKVMEIMGAAGAKQVVQESRFAHLAGPREWEKIRQHLLSTNLAEPTTFPISSSAMAVFCRHKVPQILD